MSVDRIPIARSHRLNSLVHVEFGNPPFTEGQMLSSAACLSHRLQEHAHFSLYHTLHRKPESSFPHELELLRKRQNLVSEWIRHNRDDSAK